MIFVGNGFGELMGSTQVNELGEIETPIYPFDSSCRETGDFLMDYVLGLSGNESVAINKSSGCGNQMTDF